MINLEKVVTNCKAITRCHKIKISRLTMKNFGTLLGEESVVETKSANNFELVKKIKTDSAWIIFCEAMKLNYPDSNSEILFLFDEGKEYSTLEHIIEAIDLEKSSSERR